jgi:hypothetical protein
MSARLQALPSSNVLMLDFIANPLRSAFATPFDRMNSTNRKAIWLMISYPRDGRLEDTRVFAHAARAARYGVNALTLC